MKHDEDWNHWILPLKPVNSGLLMCYSRADDCGLLVSNPQETLRLGHTTTPVEVGLFQLGVIIYHLTRSECLVGNTNEGD